MMKSLQKKVNQLNPDKEEGQESTSPSLRRAFRVSAVFVVCLMLVLANSFSFPQLLTCWLCYLFTVASWQPQ